ISELFKELVEDYKERNIKIVSVAGGYSFATDKKWSSFIENYTHEDKKNKLTRSTLEVLSIVSYKQPVTRVEIDTVRGVDSSHIVRSLVEKRFIKPVGKKDVPGKPMMYGTTDSFLKHFGLNSLKDLKDYKSFGFENPSET
ncbi:MAG: SMC-Scp complex subunit ScpB, partial [Nitrospinae bacterium]|nr:SMC-Scp complex subunit ScpB [Nitrospinota bacterium]